MKRSIQIFVAALAPILASGGAIAQTYRYDQPLPRDPPPGWTAEGRSVESWDRYRYDFSGTRGRMGLGADPNHPEGPGNFSAPR
jgi:hypothetical protein